MLTALGFGAMGIGGKLAASIFIVEITISDSSKGMAYGADVGSDEERFKVLDRLFELGCTNWDTSSIYVSRTCLAFFIPKNQTCPLF